MNFSNPSICSDVIILRICAVLSARASVIYVTDDTGTPHSQKSIVRVRGQVKDVLCVRLSSNEDVRCLRKAYVCCVNTYTILYIWLPLKHGTGME